MIQLVKCKEYRRVSIVYIPIYHEVEIRSTYGRHEVCWVKNMPHQWGADWAIRYMKWYKTKKHSMCRTPGVNEVNHYINVSRIQHYVGQVEGQRKE